MLAHVLMVSGDFLLQRVKNGVGVGGFAGAIGAGKDDDARGEGGRRAATLYSIVETCRRQAIDPYRYMRDVLGRLPTWPKDALADLTPKGWKRVFPDLAAAATTVPPQ